MDEDWIEYLRRMALGGPDPMNQWVQNNPAYFRDTDTRQNLPSGTDVQPRRPEPLGVSTPNFDRNQRSSPTYHAYDESFLDYLVNGPTTNKGPR